MRAMGHDIRGICSLRAGVLRTVGLVLLGLTMAAWPALAQPDEGGTVTRLVPASSDPVDVAIAWSRFSYPCETQGGDDCPPFVLLARDDIFADSLAAGTLRGSPVDGADRPLLLTDGEALSPQTREELRRFGDVDIFILGGEAAIGPGVERELREMGADVDRFDGATRIETAIDLAAYNLYNYGPSTGYDSHAFLVRAYGEPGDPTSAFADAISVGSLAEANDTPVLLTETGSLSPQVASFLRNAKSNPRLYRNLDSVIVVGGRAAVSDQVVAQVEELGYDVQRVAGAERAATALEVFTNLQGLPDSDEAERIIVVEGYEPMAWTSGLPAAGPLLLGGGGTLPSATRDFLAGGDGGTSLICGPLLQDAACDEAAEQLGLGP